MQFRGGKRRKFMTLFHKTRFCKFRRLWLGPLLTLCVGCADGPFGLARFNPMLRDEWKKDEEFGVTNHQKIEELIALQQQASQISPAEQQRLSQELADLIRRENNVPLCVAAVRTLSEFPTSASLEGLKYATTHSDPDVRAAACEGWRRKGGPDAVLALAEVLGSDTDVDVRIVAARDLEAFRHPAAINALGLALDDTDPALQHRAVQSLKTVTGRNFGDSVPAWREYVRDGNPQPAAEQSIAQRLRNLF